MSRETVRRVFGFGAGATTIAVVAMLGWSGTASAATSNGCPRNLAGFQTSNNVGASFVNSGNVSTYTFQSFANENPAGGVPGLIKYCVYPTPPSAPASTTVSAKGANGAAWIVRKTASKDFGFVRPDGNKSNIPLDGKTTTMGTARWSTLPTSQVILLHINDPTVCTDLYGSLSSGTCFVKPGAQPMPCTAGPVDPTGIVYTSLSRDAINCAPPSEAFEAQSASEFGDEVGLASTTGHLQTLSVLFDSYACSVKGHWNTGATDPCLTNAGDTFTHPITANIYAASSNGVPGALLESVTQTFTIPYRPSADPTNCPGGSGSGIDAGSQWFNAVSGKCQYSVSTVLRFTFSGTVSLPSDVIWTVAFNTSDYGANPLRPQPCNLTDQGCPYDSLNVGTKTFSGAPYIGTDVDPNGAFLNSSWAGAYCDGGAAGTGSLRLDTNTTGTCWLGFTPLAEIKLG